MSKSTWLPLLLLAATPSFAQDDPFDTLFGEDRDADADADLPQDTLARALTFARTGRYDEAEHLVRQLLQRDPLDPPALEALGDLLLLQGRDQEARQLVQDALTARSDAPPAHILQGRLYERQGALAAAEDAYRVALALANDPPTPELPETLVRLGTLLLPTDQHPEAARLLERALQFYSRADALSPEQYVWVAEACLALENVPAVEALYQRHMADYARRMLDQALALDPNFVPAHRLSGHLFLTKYEIPQAKRSYLRAVELDPNDPHARTGLARARLESYADGFARYAQAEADLRVALATHPLHPGAHATLARMAVTDGRLDEAAQRLDLALDARPAHIELRATRAAIAVLRGDHAAYRDHVTAALALRPRCAEFFADVASLVSLKFRYAEARDIAREGLALDPGYQRLLPILGVNLTRTGDEAEGTAVLRRAFEQDPYDVYTYNQLQLFDRLDTLYTTFEDDGIILRISRDEADLSADYVLELLQECRRQLGTKYGACPDTVLVELFREHADFSARSVGLPGIPALGVCFGNVVTVLSAGERDAVGRHSWGRTLWHEFTHVCTLTRTHNRIPRWFTEGLSVYEEPRGRPSWQREYDLEIMTLMERDLLLPIAEFDTGFTKPRYPGQVIMAYYQAGMTCEFIAARWGFDAILAMLDAYAEGLDTAAVVQRVLELSPTDFDREFLVFLQRRYAPYAYRPVPTHTERQTLLDHVRAQPWDVSARGALARAYALHGQRSDAELHALQTIRQTDAAHTRWPLLLPLDRAAGHTDPAAARARHLATRQGRGDAYLALGILAQQRGQPTRSLEYLALALDTGTRDPVTAHNLRAQLLRATGDFPGSIAAYRHVLELMPPRPDILRALIATHQAAEQPDAVYPLLRRICELDSEDTQARLSYAQWAAEQQRWPDVLAVLDDINLIDPFIPPAHLLLAEAVRYTGGDTRRALREYQRALDLSVDDAPRALTGLAHCHLRLQNPDAARQALQRALELDPEHTDARALLESLR